METTKKFELSNETIEFNGITLHRIKALKNFSDVKAGDLGGWVETEDNLSQMDNAWVYSNAKVYRNAEVYDNAKICGDAIIYGNAEVYENAEICGDAVIRGNAKVCNKTDYIIFKNFWSSGRFFTWTRSNNMWSVGCFYGKGKELIEKAYKDSKTSGKEYERVVKYVDSILADE